MPRLPSLHPAVPGPVGPLAVTRTVKGSLASRNCTASFSGATVRLIEFFYIGESSGLVKPWSQQVDGTFNYDKLFLGKTELPQGRILGTSVLDNNVSFSIAWSDFKDSPPWIENVTQVDPDVDEFKTVTAYRMLELQVLLVGNFVAVPIPYPRLQFFPNEIEKDVRRLSVDCFAIGG